MKKVFAILVTEDPDSEITENTGDSPDFINETALPDSYSSAKEVNDGTYKGVVNKDGTVTICLQWKAERDFYVAAEDWKYMI